jgi:hypothetical protein
MTATPDPDTFYAWLNDDHRQTLVAPPMQTLVATQVLESAEENGLGLSNSAVTGIEVSYPDGYDPGDPDIQIEVKINRVVAIIFGRILNINEGGLSGITRQSIPQR